MTTTFNLSDASDPSGDCFVLIRVEQPQQGDSGEALTEKRFTELVATSLKSFMGAYGTGIPAETISFNDETRTGIVKTRHGLVPMLRAALTLTTTVRFTVLRFSPSLMSLAIDI